MPLTPDINQVRTWFPALASEFAYLENAGGSQVPGTVADAICGYMTSSYVQLGAGYAQSLRASATVEAAHAFMETFMNAQGLGKIVLGPSTTALSHILAGAYGETVKPGDEFIIAETSHESNAGPWEKLKSRGAVVHVWKVDPETFECSLESLRALLNERTRIVAFPHVSNILGQIVDVPAIVQLVHSVGAKVVVDGVAYAPHHAIDVAAWGVDWYVFSAYKVYGPHMAVLFGRTEAFAEIVGPNHFFIPANSVPHKFELGGISHEACAGLLALRPYLQFLAGRHVDDRETIVKAFQVMERLEAPPARRLVEYLRSKPGVRLIGAQGTDSVGTVSFVFAGKSSAAIVAEVDRHPLGIRYGHMYAYRLVTALGIPPEDGVVRVSVVHYNTLAEIERLIAVFETVLTH